MCPDGPWGVIRLFGPLGAGWESPAMLSIATVKGAGSKAMAKYYTSEFTEGVGEMAQTPEAARERSRWWGPGAAARGLADEVSQPALQAVLEGKDPRSGQVLFDPTAQQLMGVQKRLGIEREFGEVEILALREGKNPETGEELPLVVGRYVQNLFSGRRGVERQVSAVDLTLSAPKSVSLMVAAGEEGVRRAAEVAHEKAVDAAMKFVSEELVSVRRGRDGVNQYHGEEAFAALFTQLASRNHDPQLHTHCVMSTAAKGPDGRFSAMNAATLHHASKVIGSVYQAQLRHELGRELGVAWDVREDGLGEIAGIRESVLKKFSTRSAKIDESIDAQKKQDEELIRDVELRKDVYERALLRVQKDPEVASEEDLARVKKLETYQKLLRDSYRNEKFNASRKRLLVQLTRGSKDEPSEEELRQRWEGQWAESGVSWDLVVEESQRQRWEQDLEAVEAGGVEEQFRTRLAESLTEQEAVFNRKEALVTGMRLADPSMSSEDVVRQVDQFLSEGALQIQADESKFANWSLGVGAKYTTQAVLDQERALTARAEKMLDRTDSGVCDVDVVAQMAREYTLNDEQEGLLAAMCLSGQQLVMARGIAGSGKTHVLGSAASVLREEGYQVVGLATAAATAQRLSSESGFDRSSSIDRFLVHAEQGQWERGVSPALLAAREDLQSERREAFARFGELAAEAGDDEAQLEAVELERAEVMEEWQTRWAEWLRKAGAEQKEREEAGAALDTRQELLDAEEEYLDRKAALMSMMDPGQREMAADELRAEEARLEEARERLAVDREAFRRELSPTEELPDTNKVVIVVDEAGMVETGHYDRLTQLAEQRDWKIAFVGDDRQLQEVNRGGSFRMLAGLGGSVELGTARRARSEWELRAQTKWWSSESYEAIGEVLEDYMANDRVTFVTDRVVRTAIAMDRVDPDKVEDADREVARLMLRDKWLADHADNVESLIMAARRDDVYALNSLVQESLIEQGELGQEGLTTKAADVRNGRTAGEYTLHKGDRVMVMKNVAGTPVKNGMAGQVTHVRKDGAIDAELPTGPDGEMRLHRLEKGVLDSGFVALGYATTAHKAQGASVERGYVLAEKGMAREQLYPSMTRGKGVNEVVWLADKKSESTPQEQLLNAMVRSGRKLTATESLTRGPSDEEIEKVIRSADMEGVHISDDEAAEMVAEQHRRAYQEQRVAVDARSEVQAQAKEKLSTQVRERSLAQERARTIEPGA